MLALTWTVGRLHFRPFLRPGFSVRPASPRPTWPVAARALARCGIFAFWVLLAPILGKTCDFMAVFLRGTHFNGVLCRDGSDARKSPI